MVAKATADRLALEFAGALGKGEYARAHALLTSAEQGILSASKLQSEFADMTAYGKGAPTILEVVTTLDDWPDKQADDVRWVYVAVANDTYSEAVAVTVINDEGRLAIRNVEWGRP